MNNQFLSTNTQLKQNITPENQHYISILHDSFTQQGHKFMIIDLGGSNLYNILANRNFEGFSLSHIQSIARDLLHALIQIHRIGIIHADIKPENIIQVNPYSIHVKLIDFGNCQTINNTLEDYYITTRYYRAPETFLGRGVTQKIDVWALGCVLCELFLGLPILPAMNEYHLVSLIEQTIGPFPTNMVDNSPKRDLMFNADYTVKSAETITQENPAMSFESFEPYFIYQQLRDILENYPIDNSFNEARERLEILRREKFINLIIQMLKIDPEDRLSAEEALQHPFMRMQMD